MINISLIVISIIITVFSELVIAEEPVSNNSLVSSRFIPTSLRAEVGVIGSSGAAIWTENYGGAITWTANPYIDISLGYNGSTISTTNNVQYDVDGKINSMYLNTQIHPWGTSLSKFSQSLYIVAGAAYIDNDFDVTRKLSEDTMSVNGVSYSYNGMATGKISYKNNIAPYLGGGFSTKLTDHIGFFGEIGGYYTGNPDFELNQQNSFIKSADGARELNLSMIENEIQYYENYVLLVESNLNMGGVGTEKNLSALKNKILNEKKDLNVIKNKINSAKKSFRTLDNEISNDEKYAWILVAKLGISYHF